MRATVEVVYHANSVGMTFRDQEKAKAAYDKISAALKEYKMFKNDREETVEIDAEQGLSTLKLERIDAVLFNEQHFLDEEDLREKLNNEKRAREMREEMGLPDLLPPKEKA